MVENFLEESEARGETPAETRRLLSARILLLELRDVYCWDLDRFEQAGVEFLEWEEEKQ
jgi:hypothetical protein